MKRLWVFDFDGSLSEFVADRTAASLLPEARILLSRLSRSAGATVAVISSRTLSDLIKRVDVPDIYLGGSSGLFWVTPHGITLSPPKSILARIEASRSTILPQYIALLKDTPVELEDKDWAVTAHLRNTPPNQRELFAAQIIEFCIQHGLPHSAGQLAIEVSFDEEVRKVSGLRRLLSIVDKKYEPHQVVYAGDDENDAEAMAWLTSEGGVAFAVGTKILVPDAESVSDPVALVQRINEILAGYYRKTAEGRS